MQKRIGQFYLIPLILMIGVSGVALAAKGQTETEQSLSKIAQEIKKLNEQDIQLEGQAGKLSRQLRESSKRLDSVSRKAKKLNAEIRQQEQALTKLLQRKDDALMQRERSQVSLQKNLIAQQKIKRSMKASALDSSQVGEVLRLEYWLNHLNREHTSLIADLRALHDELDAAEQTYQEKLVSIRSQRKALNQQQASLKDERKKREKLVSKIKSQRKANDGRKKALKADQVRLTKLLERLKFTERFPEFAADGKTPFGKLKGKLPWPVKARPVKSQFSSGVTLTVKPGTSVRAISHGRVMFADWMKGFGMLVIIDHGDGYLSLYGHNESLYTKAGEWVEPGTVVSSSGQSTVGGDAGVYFEIRRKARALNPTKWCVKR